MTELEKYIKVEMIRDIPLEDIVDLMDNFEAEVKTLKAVATEAVDYLAANLKSDSPEDYEPEKSPLIMGLREKIKGKV